MAIQIPSKTAHPPAIRKHCDVLNALTTPLIRKESTGVAAMLPADIIPLVLAR